VYDYIIFIFISSPARFIIKAQCPVSTNQGNVFPGLIVYQADCLPYEIGTDPEIADISAKLQPSLAAELVKGI